MAALILPRGFTQQPQQAVQIDWGNPLARGLCFAVVGSFGPFDLISGKFASTWNGQRPITQKGVALSGTGSGKTAEFDFDPVVGSTGSGSGEVTFLSIANPISEAREGCLIGVMMNGSPFKQLALYANFDANVGGASAGMLSIEGYNATATSFANASNVIDGQLHTFIGIYRGNATPSLYVDGSSRATTTSANSTAFGLDATSRISVGNESWNSSTRVANAKIPLSLAWNRALSSSEVSSVTDNPWQLFKAPSRRIWVGASGSPDLTLALTGASATSAAGASSPSTVVATTGNSSAGTVGSVSHGLSVAASGVSVTTAAGTVASGVTVALTGVSTTGAVGSVTTGADVTAAVTGVSATAAAGSVVRGHAIGLTGTPATGAVGSVGATQAGAASLTGTPATASAGTATASLSVATTGVSGSGQVGAPAVARESTIAGVGASSAVGSVGLSVTVALSGITATASVGSLVISSGDIIVSLTGVSVLGLAGSMAAIVSQADRQYPLSGLTQGRPLAGQRQRYPLEN